MLRRGLRSTLALPAFFSLAFATAWAHGLEMSASAVIRPEISGGVHGSQNLTHDLTGKHETLVESYFPAEAVSPLIHQGFMRRMETVGSTMLEACMHGTFVGEGSANCDTFLRVFCPSGEGVYRADSRGAALTLVKLGFSGKYYATCRPEGPFVPECSVEYPYTRLVVVDLDSGRTFQPPPIEGHTLVDTETRDGKSFFFPEWAVLDLGAGCGASGGAQLLAGSSTLASARAATYAGRVAERLGAGASGRILVVEAPRHIGNRTEPLVRLASLAEGKPPSGDLAEGRVVFRAELDPHGLLDVVEVLEGDVPTAQALAADLRLDGAGDADHHHLHRTVVFAAFEVEEGRPRVVAIVPVLPQCCCTDGIDGGVGCEDDPFDPPMLSSAERLPEHLLHPGGRPRPGEAGGPFAAAGGEVGGEGGVFDQVAEGVGQGADVAGVDEEGGVAGDLREARDVGGDDRDARGHRFEHGEAEALV